MRNERNPKRIILCAALCLAVCASPVFRSEARAAAPKLMTVAQAQSVAVAKDTQIQKKTSEIALKQIKYNEAVAGAKAKAKNMASFRWSPLLSFKFPEKLDLTMDYELVAKPLELQIEINTLKREKDDLVFESRRRVSKLFSKIYVAQEKIAFAERVLAATESDLKRNEALLIAGTAKQADVDALRASAEATRANLALIMRGFENDKRELSDLTKLDVSSGYLFKNPMKTVNLTRDRLETLVDYTLTNDQTYYTARMTETVARIDLDTYERLFRGQYGSKVNAVAPFLSQARAGADIDNAAFKMAYDAMLKNFDAPWAGRKRILFFTFSREWLKGQISGTRYVEDEMYGLYSAALDYRMAFKDRQQAEKDLRKNIASSYESLVTAKNAADAMLSAAAATQTKLGRLIELNRLGKATFTEVRDKQADFQEQQNDAIESLATYNDLLFDFDRLTCGGLTKLLTDADMTFDTGSGVDSRVDKPMYHIYSDIADMIFVFGIQIPEDYTPEIDTYEIWYENVRIGERTPADREIRHLTLDYGESNTLTVRLFNADEYVDECEIDVTEPRGELKLSGGVAQSAERAVGLYAVKIERYAEMSLTELSLTMPPGSPVKSFRLSMDGKTFLAGAPVPVDQSFRYLSLLSADMSVLRVELYDAGGARVYTARFEPRDMGLYAETNEPGGTP